MSAYRIKDAADRKRYLEHISRKNSGGGPPDEGWIQQQLSQVPIGMWVQDEDGSLAAGAPSQTPEPDQPTPIQPGAPQAPANNGGGSTPSPSRGGSMASLMSEGAPQQGGFQNVQGTGGLRPELGQRIMPQYSASLASLRRAVY